jgi:hypothetical protein
MTVGAEGGWWHPQAMVTSRRQQRRGTITVSFKSRKTKAVRLLLILQIVKYRCGKVLTGR